MRSCVWAVLGGALLALGACTGPAQPPAQPSYRPIATIKDIMDSMVDPSADALWNSVATIVSADGVEERAPHTDDEWTDARRHALRLLEATNLLIMPNRAVARPGEKSENPGIELGPEDIQKVIDGDRADYLRLVQALYDAALPMLKATHDKDAKALFDTGDALDAACENCHIKYWYPADAKPENAPSLRDKR